MTGLPLTQTRANVWAVAARFASHHNHPSKRRHAWHNPGFGEKVATLYMSQPVLPEQHSAELYRVSAVWRQLSAEVANQFIAMKEFIRVEFINTDPYASYTDLAKDLDQGFMSVMRTATTGGHPLWTERENDMFRAVHDVFGHYRNDVGFDRDGEDAAYRAHSEMFSDYVRPALATETRGQSSALVYAEPKGEFKEQKAFLAPQWMADTYHYNYEF